MGRGTQVGSEPAFQYGPPDEGFENPAYLAWEAARKRYTARPPGYRRPYKRGILPLDVTYEELLTTSAPFQQHVPLAEMVDFLVDVWEEDGLW